MITMQCRNNATELDKLFRRNNSSCVRLLSSVLNFRMPQHAKIAVSLIPNLLTFQRWQSVECMERRQIDVQNTNENLLSTIDLEFLRTIFTFFFLCTQFKCYLHLLQDLDVFTQQNNYSDSDMFIGRRRS